MTIIKNVLLTTEDYSIFKKQVGNRELKRVEDLKKTIKYINGSEYPFYSPIIVNDDFEVIDGQHRLQICIELQTKVEFIVRGGLNILDTLDMNRVANAWDLEEIVTNGINMEIPLYLKAQEFAQKTGITPVMVLGIYDPKLVNRGNALKMRYNPNINIYEFEKVVNRRIKNASEIIKELKPNKDKQSKVSHTVLGAIITLIETADYKQETFLKQLKKYRHMILISNSKKHMLEQFENVYNFNRRGRNLRIDF